MRRKKRSHKDDCASTKRCNILSAPGNVDSTKQTDPRAKPILVCACTNTFLYYFHISYITHVFFLHFSHTPHSLILSQKSTIFNLTLQKLSHCISTYDLHCRKSEKNVRCVNNFRLIDNVKIF